MNRGKQVGKLILLIALLIGLMLIMSHVSISASSYYQKIGGKVTNEEDGLPIENVKVELYKTNGNYVTETMSDGSGNYTFTNIEPGEYYLRYSYTEREIDEIKISRQRYEYEQKVTSEINIGFNIPAGFDVREIENKVKNAIQSNDMSFKNVNTYDSGTAKTREAFSKDLRDYYGKPFKKMSIINIIDRTMTSHGKSDEGTVIPNFISTFNIYIDDEAITKRLCDFTSCYSVNYNYEELVERVVASFGAKRKIITDDFGNSDTTPKLKINSVHDNFDTTNINVELKLKDFIPNPGDFITGCVYLEGTNLTDEEYNKYLDNSESYKKVNVKLIQEDGTEISSQQVNGSNGTFGFVRPSQGKYKLAFEYNGQEYYATDATETNRANVNNNCKLINNDIAKRMIKYEESLVNVTAETSVFEIKADVGAPGDADYFRETPKIIDMHLEKREEFNIDFKKQIDIVKVKLSDGQIYQENLSSEKPQISMRQIIMDEELMHGATMEIEYLITAESDNMDIEEIKIIDYLDYENNKIEYNPNLKLLSSNIENKNLGWEVIKDKNELKNLYEQFIDEELLDKDETNGGLKPKEYLIGNMQKQSDGTYQIRLVISKLIGSNLDEEELIYSNSTEIIAYSNTDGRRIAWEDENNLNSLDLNIPGNYKPSNIEVKGIDTTVAEDVFIIPPFGKRGVFINLNEYIQRKNEFLCRN